MLIENIILKKDENLYLHYSLFYKSIYVLTVMNEANCVYVYTFVDNLRVSRNHQQFSCVDFFLKYWNLEIVKLYFTVLIVLINKVRNFNNLKRKKRNLMEHFNCTIIGI